MNNHPYHIVDNSPWPIIGSIGLMTLTSGMVLLFQESKITLMMMGMMITVLTMIQWWRDIIRESTYQGYHTKKVTKSMKLGMMLFILSEVMFFLSFFWAFFHSSLSPSMEIGMMWPPMGIKPFNPLSIPMLNTTILLSSGISMTWAHSAIINNNMWQGIKSMILTISLGMYFSILQVMEYFEAPFSMADSVYGSSFFMATGFHGIHVMIGTTFIMIMTMRLMKMHLCNKHHVGFECSAWYWHFVDVVWLFLYLSIYWWGS
uniref:Cytochrome c oxidase subunit 3 n=1 Tax=Stictocephala bisonia TaxID=1585304 RepID=A0A894JQE4_9HEMI|nr:cytochrome c oxidase subunit III [Stictocephala bisonia]QRV59922.1 cytochrome c oxidase subunit III [Stictocephala bisonia]